MTISVDPRNPINAETFGPTKTERIAHFGIVPSKGTGVFTGNETLVPPTDATLNPNANSITLTFAAFPADIYQLQVKGDKIGDVYGNLLVGDSGVPGTLYTKILGGDGLGVAELAPKSRPQRFADHQHRDQRHHGRVCCLSRVRSASGCARWFQPQRQSRNAVVRLYYYRERSPDRAKSSTAKSNRTTGQPSIRIDNSRTKPENQANQFTAARQNAERNAIILANQTRQKENELQLAENSLNGSIQQLTNFKLDSSFGSEEEKAAMLAQLESLVTSLSNQVNDLKGDVQAARDKEVQANEKAQQAEAQEKLAREEQFRREVAAAHSDPDTYAPANLNSADPVEQVSVSVVGEGLIELRGPLKGINLIRTAIDQLDTPVGQVRVSLHTIQINGERADRMEVVAKKVQTYIDHARFLTMQSSEMLRKAVVQVASQKAEEASALFPGATQMDRDERYIIAFFGKDFIDELKAMDSEFLHTGNKLLSLHSMDTTSLASALNLMALAKNSTRQEIFAAFDEMCQTQLPQAEQNYFAAGWTCPKKKKNCFHRCKDCEPEYCPMACNARFESLRGFFDMQITNDDTMTPLQREFIRLAQIFKSRLVTELEYKQRVMERAIIEERLGNRNAELKAAISKEENANKELARMQNATIESRVRMVKLVKEIEQGVQASIEAAFNDALNTRSEFPDGLKGLDKGSTGTMSFYNKNVEYDVTENRGTVITFQSQNQLNIVQTAYSDLLTSMTNIHSTLQLLADVQGNQQFSIELKTLKMYLDLMNSTPVQLAIKDGGSTPIPFSMEVAQIRLLVAVDKLLDSFSDPINGARNILLDGLSESLSTELGQILTALGSKESKSIDKAYSNWLGLKKTIRPLIQSIPGGPEKAEIESKVAQVDIGFSELFGKGFLLEAAEDQATNSRRPLDHKKFLDMLVDDLEEKYIELLDGTRAQVANIDNYLKRVTTALDDDFNTQFYYPAFKYIREANVSYDVQFGQFETTTLLANNREFAKADPSATMEFNLPERDIMIVEGLNGAKALMGDIGALANDPAFLAMARLESGDSPSSYNAGASGGNGVVRNVLPGLGSTTSEQVMSQNSNGGQQFGSNLENLIPDPAVYKFETGTGFEIRPVIQPDGQAVVFDFNYMYTTQIREPVRADEKHLGRVKRHYIDTDVQLSNFELREGQPLHRGTQSGTNRQRCSAA